MSVTLPHLLPTLYGCRASQDTQRKDVVDSKVFVKEQESAHQRFGSVVSLCPDAQCVADYGEDVVESKGLGRLSADTVTVSQVLAKGNQMFAWSRLSRPKMTLLMQALKHFALPGGGRFSTWSDSAQLEETVIGQVQLIFGPCADEHLRKQHLALSRVVHRLFLLEVWTASISPSERTLTSCLKHFTESSAFIGFYMLLSIYVLFVHDTHQHWSTNEEDHALRVVATVVFVFFILELLCFGIAQPDYLCSLPFLVDIISLISLTGDTVLLNLEHDHGSIISGLIIGRSLRLTRYMLLFRFTRLVPWIRELCIGQQAEIAQHMLNGRLWRVFSFLDDDRDEHISNFDLKVFYLSLLQECSATQEQKAAMLAQDIHAFCSLACDSEEYVGTLTFNIFREMFSRTALGKLQLHLCKELVLSDKSSWTVTRRATNSMALKLCLGFLLILFVMNLTDSGWQDMSAESGLALLSELAPPSVADIEATDAISGSDFCKLIMQYQQSFTIIILHINGWTHVVNGGSCFWPGIPLADLNPFQYADDMVRQLKFRDSEVQRVWWPPSMNDKRSVSSGFVLVDQHVAAKDYALRSTLKMLVMVMVLLVFSQAFTVLLGSFSGSFLHPLRLLLDDLMAMSSLELIIVDSDMPQQPTALSRRNSKLTNSVGQLQDALRHLQAAMRSWSKFVPPSVVQRLLSNQTEATIGVTPVRASILFCDILNFDDLVASLSPQEVLKVLDFFLCITTCAVEENNGTVLEFIGDEVLAVFNTPVLVKLHTFAAVSSCLTIHSAAEQLPKGLCRPLQCCCGVHTSDILAGNIGSSKRLKYGLLGDGINLTARLKGLNRQYHTKTLISDVAMADETCKSRFVVRPVDLVAVKGRQKATQIYEVMGKADVADKNTSLLADMHAQAFQCYLQREFSTAADAFNDISKAFEAVGKTDEASLLLQRRCEAYAQKPPPADWDGVERLKKK